MPGTNQSTEELIISKEEIRKDISLLKNNKAPESDPITAEVLKAGGELIVNMLHLIFLKIVNEENTPLHFSKMLVTPIFEKGDECLPGNYRAISLLFIPGKVLNKILLNKIREKTEVYTSDRQYGCRPNRGIVDAIFVVRQLIQKARERVTECHYHFVYFKGAFDTTWRKALWKMMGSIGINKKIVSIVGKMYDETTCAVALMDF